MKKVLYSILAIGALSVAGLAGSSLVSTADAQKKKGNDDVPLILTVSPAQIIAQSVAGQSVKTQAETLQKSVAAELTGEKTKLEADIENYQKNKELWAQDVRQQKEQELAARSQVGLPQMGKVMEAAFVQSIRKAENDILKEAEPIMQKIIDKRGATLLLDRQSVMYAATEIDITQEVIASLDKKIKTVKVQDVSLAELQRLAAEASKKNAAQNQ